MSAQSSIGFGIMVVMTAVIFGISGFVVSDVLVPWINHFAFAGYKTSQDSFNTVSFLLQLFVATPFILLMLWGYDHINNSNTQSGGEY